ncbi:MAG: hypothetical protein KBF89_08275 [Acidimicrobiia bacterium]|nr:hypothetical protein [Acidimicrobiia bacterium]
MQPGDIEFQIAYEKLTRLPEQLKLSDKTWIEFLCEDLPKFEGNALSRFIFLVSKDSGIFPYSKERLEILETLSVSCYDLVTGAPTTSISNIVASALESSLRLCEIEEVEDRVYGNITTSLAAKALYGHLLNSFEYHLSFVEYLLDLEVIPTEVDISKGISFWDTKVRWPYERDQATLANHPSAGRQISDGLPDTVDTAQTLLKTADQIRAVGQDDFNVALAQWLHEQDPPSSPDVLGY